MGLCTSSSTAVVQSADNFESVFGAFPAFTLNDILLNDKLFFPELNGVISPVEEHKRVVMVTGRAMVDQESYNKYAILCSSVFSEATVHYESTIWEADTKSTGIDGWHVVGKEDKYCSYYLVDPKNPEMKVEISGHRNITSDATDFIEPVDPVTGVSIEPIVLTDLTTQRLSAIQYAFIKKYIETTEVEVAHISDADGSSTGGSANQVVQQIPKFQSTNSSISIGSNISSTSGSSKRCYQSHMAFKLSEKCIGLGDQLCVLGVLNKRTITDQQGVPRNQYYMTPINKSTFSIDLMKRRKWTFDQKKIWFDYFDKNPASTLFVTTTKSIIKLRPVQKISFDRHIKISKRISSAVNKEILQRRREQQHQQQMLVQKQEMQQKQQQHRAMALMHKQYSGSTTSVSTNVSASVTNDSIDVPELLLQHQQRESVCSDASNRI